MTFEEFVSKVLSIAKIGNKFSKDPYALENYQELEALSLELLNENLSEESIDANIFKRDLYPTPQVSVRTLVVNEDDDILFVKERSDQKWAVPGGWCDLFVSPKENAVKEVFEEAGIEIEVDRLLAVFQRERYKNKIRATHISEYVLYFVAEVKDVSLDIGFEVEDADFFAIDQLPELSFKNTQEELDIAWNVYKKNDHVFVD